VGPEGVLTGTARVAQEVRDHLALEQGQAAEAQQRRLLERKRLLLEQRVAALHAEFAAEQAELEAALRSSDTSRQAWESQRERASLVRGAAASEVRVSARPPKLQQGNGARRHKSVRA